MAECRQKAKKQTDFEKQLALFNFNKNEPERIKREWALIVKKYLKKE
jgi:hypothetical protein